jgi:hypothetical protein
MSEISQEKKKGIERGIPWVCLLRRGLPCLPAVVMFFLFLAITCLPGLTHAAVVILEWSPNPEPDLAGYTVYYGESSGVYSCAVDVGNHTSCAISDACFQEGSTYYFAATAYDEYGNESAFSDEVPYTFGAPDEDGDGISDYDEINEYGTDPDKSDTDDDGFDDGDELSYWGDAWDADYDNDGLINLLDWDSDGDGICDGREFGRGSDPSDPASMAAGVPFVVIQLLIAQP